MCRAANPYIMRDRIKGTDVGLNDPVIVAAIRIPSDACIYDITSIIHGSLFIDRASSHCFSIACEEQL